MDERIRSDYGEVLEELESLAHGFSKNALILDRDYINPSVTMARSQIPLEDVNGLFVYQMGILRGLSEILMTGKIEECKEFMKSVRPPSYIVETFN